MPMGAPLPGGIPMGGPIGGHLTVHKTYGPFSSIKILRLPGGGAPRPIGGGAPRPGGYCVGAPAMLAPAAAAATVPRPCGVITCGRPPTPLTGPANPAGACGIGAPAGTPRPAARPTPGPPATPARGTRAISWACSLVIGAGRGVAYLILRNSSQSHRMRFMCLSKALKVPMKMRPSCRMHLMRKSMCCSILLLLPTVWGRRKKKKKKPITHRGIKKNTHHSQGKFSPAIMFAIHHYGRNRKHFQTAQKNANRKCSGLYTNFYTESTGVTHFFYWSHRQRFGRTFGAVQDNHIYCLKGGTC
uniref:Uncharacterized protein n=1 Tax=Hippocampus comes TaxID=109280 RepID=A0A3Q2Y330_HIPCM